MSYSSGLPAAHAPRHDGWTPARQMTFLTELAQHGVVADAARAAGLSASSAYRLRGRKADGAFAFGWKAATALAYERLRDLAMDRVVNGVATPYVRGGEVTTVIRHSDRLLIALLNHLRPREGAPPASGFPKPPPPEPSALWAATVHAYETAEEDGCEPSAPRLDHSGNVAKSMSRAEFLAVIEAQPDVAPPSESGNVDWSTATYDAASGAAAAGTVPA